MSPYLHPRTLADATGDYAAIGEEANDDTPPQWKRWHVALMLLAAIAGVIGVAANERYAAAEEARTEVLEREGM